VGRLPGDALGDDLRHDVSFHAGVSVGLVPFRAFVVAAECWSRVPGVQMGGEHTTEFGNIRSRERLPMKGMPNEVTSADSGWRALFAFCAQWPAAAEFARSSER